MLWILGLLLPACAPAQPEHGAPMDGLPAATTTSGSYTADVEQGGTLILRGAFGERTVATKVDARVAFAPDRSFLIYAQQGFMAETDLWRVNLPDGAPVQLTDWRGSEDRPVVSPDGEKIAFVSGMTGVASWYLMDVAAALVPVERATQLTNTALGPKRPGFAPEGWTPVPDGTVYAWSADGLGWTARGQSFRVDTP